VCDQRGLLLGLTGGDWKDVDTWAPAATPTGIGALKYGMSAATAAIETVAESGFDTLAKREYLHGSNDGNGYTAATDGTAVTGAAGNGRNTHRRRPHPLVGHDLEVSEQPGVESLDPDPQQHHGLPVPPRRVALTTSRRGLQMTSTATANVVTVTNNCTGAPQINQTVNLGTAAAARHALREG